MLAQTVTAYETIKFNLSKWSVFESITFKKWVIIMIYNVAEYVIEWRFNGLYDRENMADLSQTVFVRSNNEAFKRTNTNTYTHTNTHTHTCTNIHGHTPTNAIGENAE